jgi:hypothetical protein
MTPEHRIATPADRQRFVAQLMALPLTRPLDVLVTEAEEHGTAAQRRGYWWRMGQLEKFLRHKTGMKKDALHAIFRQAYCPEKRVVVGAHVFYVKSSELLSKDEKTEFLNDCEEWAREEFGYDMPPLIPASVREDIPEEHRCG